MSKIPTAEEILNKHLIPANAMIEFAKLHVEAALNSANEEAIESDDLQEDCYSGRYHMKNSYPLEKIK
jgi:hypothetical protein